jgi:hypothetical protein
VNDMVSYLTGRAAQPAPATPVEPAPAKE